jgi:hypothetical protein
MNGACRRWKRPPASTQASWPAEIEAAKQRALARLWRKLGAALDAADHPRVQWAMTFLQDDPPEQADLDLDRLQRWHAAHPDTCYPEVPGVRERIERKLEEMAQRLEAHHGPA